MADIDFPPGLLDAQRDLYGVLERLAGDATGEDWARAREVAVALTVHPFWESVPAGERVADPGAGRACLGSGLAADRTEGRPGHPFVGVKSRRGTSQ